VEKQIDAGVGGDRDELRAVALHEGMFEWGRGDAE